MCLIAIVSVSNKEDRVVNASVLAITTKVVGVRVEDQHAPVTEYRFFCSPFSF
jgi:hypothetical protein